MHRKKKIKSEHEKVKSFVHDFFSHIEVDAEDDPKHHEKKNMKQEIQKLKC